MYNQKVLEHFQNPRNQGVIKDADGVGQVGNPVCLLPQEKVFLNSKFEDIKKAVSGFIVFSHNSSKNKILNRSIRNYNGEIITLKNCLGKISLTPEHLVLAMKLPEHYDFFRTKNKQKLIPAWYHAEQLKKRDVVLYPLPKTKKDIKFIEINVAKLKYDFRSGELPSRVPLNQSLMRLFGYFMAEGNIQDKISRTYISFVLNINEREIIDDIKKISQNLFGIKAKIKEKPKVKTAVVFLYHARLTRFFKRLFGNGAGNKYFPEFIMDLPPLNQRSLIKGLWLGDGYINLKRVGPRAGYATVSYQLAQQIKNLLLRQGIASSIYTELEKETVGVKHKMVYRIHVGQRDSLIKLAGILGKKYSPDSYKSISSWFDDNYFYTPITNIKKTNYRGRVYNLEVEKAHSFISEAFCLHNCGDIMKIYIKVTKNKKGEEIIKDIKFETLGCGAAIATSSMLTEMVKGKTIEEALKIGKLDIAKELGGLPPVKLHCSILAHEGLAEAVKDYRNKNTRI